MRVCSQSLDLSSCLALVSKLDSYRVLCGDKDIFTVNEGRPLMPSKGQKKT